MVQFLHITKPAVCFDLIIFKKRAARQLDSEILLSAPLCAFLNAFSFFEKIYFYLFLDAVFFAYHLEQPLNYLLPKKLPKNTTTLFLSRSIKKSNFSILFGPDLEFSLSNFHVLYINRKPTTCRTSL